MSLIPPLELATRFPPANVLQTQLQLHRQMLYRQHITHHHHHHHHTEEIGNNGWLLPPTSGAGPTLPGDVTVSLQNAKLWQQFHSETTEMIITKLGRRMFPSLQLQIDGLERRVRYCLLLEIAPASRRRHKYVGGGVENGGSSNSRGWTSAGPAEPQPHVNRRVYLHPDSPATGTHWMQHPVSFNKLKLTNNAVDHHNNVVLTSMHKYIPRIWIVRCDDIARLTSLFSQPASSFCFSETEFIAVTAYQNENITKLKIDNNPFAKGFRETGQSRCKRKMQSFDESMDGITEDGTDLEDRSFNEDEESNVSSSESESNRDQNQFVFTSIKPQGIKRGASETRTLDDSGINRSGGTSHILFSNKKEEISVPQLRLHRPWIDDGNKKSLKSSEISLENGKQKQRDSRNTLMSQQHLCNALKNDNNRSILPSQLQISAIDLARIQHYKYYQHLQYEQYYQFNQIKNFAALYIPFGSVTNPVRPGYLYNKYNDCDVNFPINSPLSPALSPSISTDGTSASS